jgi:hypothetical protein
MFHSLIYFPFLGRVFIIYVENLISHFHSQFLGAESDYAKPVARLTLALENPPQRQVLDAKGHNNLQG